MNAVTMPQTYGLTPVTSYVPSGGFHEAPIPMGKYYPSNYERRHNSTQGAPRAPDANQQQSPPPPPPPSSDRAGPSSVKSDTAVPQYNNQAGPAELSSSEAAERILQYQRDMVAQAWWAAEKARRELAGKEGASAALAAAFLHGAPTMSRFHAQYGPLRPTSPRLHPLGSPGPVTPLALEGSDGYWTARGGVNSPNRGVNSPRARPSPGAGAAREAREGSVGSEGQAAVKGKQKAEGEKSRPSGQSSPAGEPSGFKF